MEAAARHVLEAGQRLSRSRLWQLQRELYDAQGIQAWRRGNVPQSITTSPYIARAYAQIVLGYVRDIASRLHRTQPVYIVELGAGSGRFGLRFVSLFASLLARSSLPDIRFTYVMTDMSPALLEFWGRHARLRPLVDAGLLDFGLFDATHPGEISLVASNTALRAANPIVVFGNYFFDSIPHDSFSIQAHQLFENLVTVVSPEASSRLQDMDVSFEAQPAAPDYYPDPALNRVLAGYRERLNDAMFLMPVAGLGCIRHFQELSNNRALFVLGDIGVARESDIREYSAGGIGADSNFWLAVNFHAVGEYVRQLGGAVFHPPQRHAHLNISAFVLGSPEAALGETALAYEQSIGHIGPDDFFLLSTALANQLPSMKRGELLAFLRASGWDSDYFVQCLPLLLDTLQEVGWTGRQEIRQAAASAWEMFYPMGDTSDAADLPSGLGVLLYTIGDYAEALEYFHRSLELTGMDPRTTFNVALCLQRLERQTEAAEWLDKTLELDPTSEQALAMRDAKQS